MSADEFSKANESGSLFTEFSSVIRDKDAFIFLKEAIWFVFECSDPFGYRIKNSKEVLRYP